jgi:hypothetical protein
MKKIMENEGERYKKWRERHDTRDEMSRSCFLLLLVRVGEEESQTTKFVLNIFWRELPSFFKER